MKSKFNWVPPIIREDSTRKLIAFIFAAIVWISVRNTIGVEQMVPEGIPVNFSLPNDLLLTNTSEQRVLIKVRASEKRLSRLTPENFTITLPIKEEQYEAGKPLNLTVTPADVQAPFGVTVVDIEKEQVVAYLDRIISKKVAVVPQFTANKDGFTTGKVIIIPPTVTIMGASTLIEGKTTVKTEPIPLEGMMDSFDFDPLLSTDKSIMSISKSRVLAKVEIIKQTDNITFNSIPVRVLNSSSQADKFSFSLNTNTVNVRISGIKHIVELVKSDQIKAFIDISNLNEAGSYNVNVDYSISGTGKNIIIDSITPSLIKVTLTEKKK